MVKRRCSQRRCGPSSSSSGVVTREPCSSVWRPLGPRLLSAERRAARRVLIISTRPPLFLARPTLLRHFPRSCGAIGVGGVALLDVTLLASPPVLGALHLKHLDSHGPQVASESGPVAAGAFYPDAPQGVKICQTEFSEVQFRVQSSRNFVRRTTESPRTPNNTIAQQRYAVCTMRCKCARDTLDVSG